ncbi:MAG TPA: hypothetical protein VJH03_09860 [Blastocatellia bacterium]|nr:hypothetical protein [Blastocatellia bacterium]
MDDGIQGPNAGHSFLGRVFDAYQNMMQIAACLREAARQRSVAYPRVLELSRRETGLLEYIPEARVTRYATHENNRPILVTPVVLPYPDRSFDGCLITDVYEHIPAATRPELLREMLRVTDGLVLVASPQGNEIVTRFDRIVFDFIWGKYAERFEPLEQHISFGLEPLEQTLASLEALGADRVAALPCNYVYRWIHQILIFFDLQYRNEDAELFEPLNRIYNERLSAFDYREPCYRYLIAVATDRELDIEAFVSNLNAPRETPQLVAQTDGVLVETFRAVESNLAEKLKSCSKQLLSTREDVQSASGEIEHLNSVIRQLQRDNNWATQEIERLNSAIRQLQQGWAQPTRSEAQAPARRVLKRARARLMEKIVRPVKKALMGED